MTSADGEIGKGATNDNDYYYLVKNRIVKAPLTQFIPNTALFKML